MTGRRALLRWEYGFGRRHVPFVVGYAGMVAALYLAIPGVASGTGVGATVGALAVGSYLLVANAAFSWPGDELTTVTAWFVVGIAAYFLALPAYWLLLGPAEFGNLRALPGGRESIAVVVATCVTGLVTFPVASFRQFGRDPGSDDGSVEEDVLSEEELEEFEADDGFDWRGLVDR